ncbi:MAG: MurT ligase domain-containing protein [Gracilibacteraceae bacterium]|jgi:UDP-N-acetylmuramyl tripeptide synthase/drug/metabolite transporter (DMT)-like permease|nr:MurT ligase domain-containing protein [Gracilibacteraceae bacterium]
MKLGIFFMILAGILWSTAGVLVKYISWSPLAVVCLRSFFASGLLLLYVRQKNGLRFKLSRPVVAAALCMMATMILYISAIKLTIAANAVLLQYTAPAFIVIYTALFRRVRPHLLEIITCTLIFAGVALLFLDKIGGGHWLGNLLGLLSGVAFGAVCFANTQKGADPPAATLLGNAGLLLLLPFVFADPAVWAAGRHEWLAIIILGVCQLGGGYLFFCEGISRVPAFTAAVTATLEPVLTPVWVFAAMGEKPGSMSLLGGAFVIVVILVYNLLRAEREQPGSVSFWPALWAGRLTALALKLAGRRGTTLPGAVARRLCRQLPSRLGSAYRDGVVVITGTNGKTTTNNILAAVLAAAGKKAAFNSEGANMQSGICTALLRDATWLGRVRGDILLAEVDEGSLPEFCREIRPRLAVVTNFFRDQLDRYGELDATIAKVRASLPPKTALLLNADDPLAARLAAGREEALFYGAAALPVSGGAGGENREGRFCPHCGSPLDYTLFHYGHLGIYACSACDFRRPVPEAEATRVSAGENGIAFTVWGREYTAPLRGFYNLYNALAALAAAEWLGVPPEAGRAALNVFTARDGRMEEFHLDGGLTLILVKNPAGFNAALEAVTAADGPLRLLIAINDNAADGRDISWLWDVDFERLAACGPRLRQVVCGGVRGADMLLRLKYAGVSKETLLCAPDLAVALAALRRFNGERGGRVYVLPTYTALAPLRALLRAAERAEGGRA